MRSIEVTAGAAPGGAEGEGGQFPGQAGEEPPGGEGARALGQDADLGSIEVGKIADLIVIRQDGLHQTPAEDYYSRVVYSGRASDVRATIVGGRVLWQDGELAWADPRSIRAEALEARERLRARAGV